MKILGIIALIVFVSLVYFIGTQFYTPGGRLVSPDNSALAEEPIDPKFNVYGLTRAPSGFILQKDSMGVGQDAAGLDVFQLVYKPVGKTDFITVLHYSFPELLWQYKQTALEYWAGKDKVTRNNIDIYINALEKIEKPSGNQFVQGAKVLYGENLVSVKYYGEKKLSKENFLDMIVSLTSAAQLK